MKPIQDLKPNDVVFINGKKGLLAVVVRGVEHRIKDDVTQTGLYMHDGQYTSYTYYSASATTGRYRSSGGYGPDVDFVFYTTQSEAISNRKVELLKHLSNLKQDASKAIRAIQNFRKENFEFLNEYCTDRHIQSLKRKHL